MSDTHFLYSDGIYERRERIWGPLQLAAHLAVMSWSKRCHDHDAGVWHRNRPSVKTCPYDDACRFCS